MLRTYHRRRGRWALQAFFLSVAALGMLCSGMLLAGGSQWEGQIKAFEASDLTQPPPQHAILFIGSSSIRLWTSMASDFPNERVINRGFGGSQIADSSAFADRIIVPYHPRMIVLYAGDNDIAAGKSPEQVLADYQVFVQKIRAVLPETRIAFISIKPSLARWNLVDKIRDANALVRRFAATDQRQVFIDVFTPMLGPDGRPRQELFASDGLHLNRSGYELWIQRIGPWLN